MPEFCAADSMCLSLLVFTQLRSEVARRQRKYAVPSTEQNGLRYEEVGLPPRLAVRRLQTIVKKIADYKV